MSETPRARAWPIWITLLVTLSGLPVYMAFMQNAWVRSTGVPMFALMGLGVVAGLVLAARNRRRLVRVVAGVNVVLLGLMLFGFFQLAKLPADPVFASLTTAPDFTLVDESGNSVSLSSELAKGPGYLVFYRGHW